MLTTNVSEALDAIKNRKQLWIDAMCPYQSDNETVCGNWCARFVEYNDRVELNCGSGGLMHGKQSNT